MVIRKPAYYDQFRCAAASCPDSCCQLWEVEVDGQAAQVYENLPGPLGQRLREVLRREDGAVYMRLEGGRCPMWRQDGLCRIQAELGEAGLCQTCRQFPRLAHDYGDFRELGLELSCPEAAKYILDPGQTGYVCQELPGGEVPEYQEDIMTALKDSRERALEILSNRDFSLPQRLAQLFLLGCQVQGVLDGGEDMVFDPAEALETARELARPGDMTAVRAVFARLEILTQDWKSLLEHPQGGPWQEGHAALARYLVERYWLQAVSDWDLYSRVKFTVIACLLVRHLGGDLLRTAQLFAKEIENSAENLDALLDGAYREGAFTDDQLLGLVLE